MTEKSIQITNEMRVWLESRQQTKFEAIRQQPIYDRQIHVPVRGTSIRCLEYIPNNDTTSQLPVVVDLHGGGFTNGYPEEDDLFCRMICDQLKVRVFSVDYRLAPDFPYPEGQLDAYAVISYLHSHAEQFTIQPDKMVVCGHSAGGNYAVTVAMRTILENSFSLRGLILDYPALDMATPAKDKFYIEGGIPVALSDLFNACYARPEQAKEPLCSPQFADDSLLRQLPPTTIVSCEIDCLREEEEAFAARLAANGVEVTSRRFLGEKHAFTIQYDNPAALEAIQMMIRSIRSYLSVNTF